MAHPATREIMRELKELRDQKLEYIASGATILKSAELSTETIVGQIQGLDEFLNIKHED